MIMKKIATSALVALSILGIVSVANASTGDEFGARTAAGQQGSPN